MLSNAIKHNHKLIPAQLVRVNRIICGRWSTLCPPSHLQSRLKFTIFTLACRGAPSGLPLFYSRRLNLTTTSDVKGFFSISMSPYGCILCFSINFSTRHLMSNSSCRRSFFTTSEFSALVSSTIALALSMLHPVFREIKEAISSSDISPVKSLDISPTLLSYDCKTVRQPPLSNNIIYFIFYYLLNRFRGFELVFPPED